MVTMFANHGADTKVKKVLIKKSASSFQTLNHYGTIRVSVKFH